MIQAFKRKKNVNFKVESYHNIPREINLELKFEFIAKQTFLFLHTWNVAILLKREFALLCSTFGK